MKLSICTLMLLCLVQQRQEEVISVKAKLFKEEAFYPYCGIVLIEGDYFFQLKDITPAIKYNDVFETEVMCPREVLKGELLKDSMYLIQIDISDKEILSCLK